MSEVENKEEIEKQITNEESAQVEEKPGVVKETWNSTASTRKDVGELVSAIIHIS